MKLIKYGMKLENIYRKIILLDVEVKSLALIWIKPIKLHHK